MTLAKLRPDGTPDIPDQVALRRRLRYPGYPVRALAIVAAVAVVTVLAVVVYPLVDSPRLPAQVLHVDSVEHSHAIVPGQLRCSYSGHRVVASATFVVVGHADVLTAITVDVLGPRGVIGVIRSAKRQLAPRRYPWHGSLQVGEAPAACAFVFHGLELATGSRGGSPALRGVSP